MLSDRGESSKTDDDETNTATMHAKGGTSILLLILHHSIPTHIPRLFTILSLPALLSLALVHLWWMGMLGRVEDVDRELEQDGALDPRG